MSLPQFIPLQSVPFGHKGDDGSIYVEINWYLFLYNLWVNVLGGSGTPIPSATQISMTDSEADGSDVVQAYREIKNAEAIGGQIEEMVSVDLQRIRQYLENLGAIEAQDIELAGADVADLRRRDANVQALLPDSDVGPSLRDMANALLLAIDVLPQDPMPAAQPAQTVTVGASPFTYTASFNGLVSVTAGTVSAISIVRQGTSVATGMTAGLIHLRRLDQMQITYSSAPTVVFLPD